MDNGRQDEGQGLAGASGSDADHVSSAQDNGPRLRLDGRRPLEARAGLQLLHQVAWKACLTELRHWPGHRLLRR